MEKYFITSFYYPFVGGGAELSNKLLNEGLKKNKFKILTFGYENKSEKINDANIERIRFNFLKSEYLKKVEGKEFNGCCIKYDKLSSYFFTYFYKKKISKLLNNKKIKLLHTSGTHGLNPEIWWKKAKQQNGIVIHTLRDPQLIYTGTIESKGSIKKIIDYFHKKYYIRYVNKYVDYIHSPTQYMIDLHKKKGFKFKNIKVIPNTVDIEFQRLDYKNKVIDLVYVGVLSENKGIKTLIKLKEENSFLNIVFVGEGILSENAKKVGIQVTGWLQQSEVFEWIRKSKILVLPSEWEEAFGRVLIEGIALGTISIGSNMGGIPEVLFNDSRYIFEARNIVELNQKIERVLSLNEIEYLKELLRLQEKMQIYKYENHIKQFEEFYDEILKNRG